MNRSNVGRVERLTQALLIAVLAFASRTAPAQSPAAPPQRSLPDLTAAIPTEAASVVTITTTLRTPHDDAATDLPPATASAPREPWIRSRRADPEQGLASGFVVGSDGEILTSAHAVSDVDRAIVRLADGRRFTGRIVGLDKATDIALLKIDARSLPTAAIARDARLVRGEWVVAIGSPLGLDGSVTVGIVSAAQRYLAGSPVPLIQTDVAINPGSSGGPLFNLRGEVVGVNAMILSRSGGYMGVAFSVPIDVALHVVDELRATGHVSRGHLGAKTQELTPELARSFGAPSVSGALVLHVLASSPAERAGLRSGDIVLGLEGSTDAGYAQLQQQVAAARPGQRLTLNVWRHGALRQVVLTVDEARFDSPARPDPPAPMRDDRLGLQLAELPAARRNTLGVDGGVPVLEAHGAASQGGVRSDDVIVAVGDRTVRSVADFDAALAASPLATPVALLVLRDGALAYVAVERHR